MKAPEAECWDDCVIYAEFDGGYICPLDGYTCRCFVADGEAPSREQFCNSLK